MNLDLIIINPHSEDFKYIPIGSFALCSWLKENGISAKIINLSQQSAASVFGHIKKSINYYNPKRVGLILHWKETLNSFLSAGAYIHQNYPHLPIFAGGITASYYAEELIKKCNFLSGVVFGDSELPMLKICKGENSELIPNLFVSGEKNVIKPAELWYADEKFLNNLDYGKLSFLENWQDYLKILDFKLGVPLAAGRGCIYNCGFCGGSRSSFLLHSSRKQLALRSPLAVVRDIETAMSFGSKNFLLTHTASHCHKIFSAIKHKFSYRLPFTLHLELWDIPDKELLQEYAETETDSNLMQRHVLFSQHASAFHERAAEQKKIIEATKLLTKYDSKLNITIFSGFYTPWQKNKKCLDQDLKKVIGIRQKFSFRKVNVALMALSTDPASRWSLEDEGIKSDLSLENIAKGCKEVNTIINNLLLHQSHKLSDLDAISFQRAWHLDNMLFNELPVLWWTMTTSLNFKTYREILEKTAEACYYDNGNRVYPISKNILLNALVLIKKSVSNESLNDNIRMRLIKELAGLYLAHHYVITEIRELNIYQNGLDIPYFLSLNPNAVYISSFNFDPLINDYLIHCRVNYKTICNCESLQGFYAYILLPTISGSNDSNELNLLNKFDGMTYSEQIIDSISSELNAPEKMVRARIFELWNTGILIAV